MKRFSHRTACTVILLLLFVCCFNLSGQNAPSRKPSAAADQHSPSAPAKKRSSSAKSNAPLSLEDLRQLPLNRSALPDLPVEVRLPPDSNEEKAASVGRALERPATLSRSEVVRVVLGGLVLLTLAYFGGHPKVQRFEQRLQIAQLATAGLPYILLGVLASAPQIGVLTAPVMSQIRPVLSFGLGWIGFAVGFRFDISRMQGFPKGISSLAITLTLLPAVVIASLSLSLLTHTPGVAVPFRDALVIAFAGAMTAKSAPFLLQVSGASDFVVNRVSIIVLLEQLAGIFGLLLLAAYFRPQATFVTWQLPGTAWVFITVGVGAIMATIIYLLFSKVSAGAPFQVVLLGAICFTAGIATFLQLSAVVVCFITGFAVVNLPSAWKEELRTTFATFERPVYFLFLVIAGALWHNVVWQGWVLMLVFVGARFLGKWVGLVLWRPSQGQVLSTAEQRGLVISPVGALSIAIVVSAQTLYAGAGSPLIVTAVIGGAILTEFIIQWTSRRGYLVAEQNLPELIQY